MKVPPFQRARIAANLGGAYGALFLVFIVLDQWWAHRAPHLPSSRTGQIYAHNEHGRISYLTAFQTTACSVLFALCGLTLLACLVIAPKRNFRVTRLGCLPVGATWQNEEISTARRDAFAGMGMALLVVLAIGWPLLLWLVNLGCVLPFG